MKVDDIGEEEVGVAKSAEDVQRIFDLEDAMHDLYGNRGTAYTINTCRPTMMSPKYRQKEERRKVLKLSMNKLKRIEDPENTLRRSILINNTVKKLQREAKDEKAPKSPTRCFDFLAKEPDFLNNNNRPSVDQLLDITNQQMNKTNGRDVGLDCEEELEDTSSPDSGPQCVAGRKRSADEASEDTLPDVLSQFFLPTNPILIPPLVPEEESEEEELNVVDVEEPPAKISKLEDGMTAADRLRQTPPLPSDWVPGNAPPCNGPPPHVDWVPTTQSGQCILPECQAVIASSSPTLTCGQSMASNEVLYQGLVTSAES